MNTGSGTLASSSAARINRRPVDQLVSTVNSTAATASGNQPPSGILVMFEETEVPSTSRNRQIVPASSHRFQPQTLHTRKPTIHDVISSVTKTAPHNAPDRPYASPKQTTT